MASGRTVLRKMKKLFDKLGMPEGSVKLRVVNRGGSAYSPSEPQSPISLGRAIVNDMDDRVELGITDVDTTTVRFWGGAIESSGLYEVTEDALIRAKLPGGAVLIRDREYELDRWVAGFTVEGYVSQWYLICQGGRQPIT